MKVTIKKQGISDITTIGALKKGTVFTVDTTNADLDTLDIFVRVHKAPMAMGRDTKVNSMRLTTGSLYELDLTSQVKILNSEVIVSTT